VRFYLTPLRMAIIKKVTNAGEDSERKVLLDAVSGDVN
jgi:hypothetical protein